MTSGVTPRDAWRSATTRSRARRPRAGWPAGGTDGRRVPACGPPGGKGVTLDVKEPDVTDELLELVGHSGAAGHDLWFNGRVDVLGREAFQRLRWACATATVQCPIDAAPAIVANPGGPGPLDELADWGIDRFSLAWGTGPTALLLDQLDRWGHEVNLYAVDNLDEFLQAVMLLPRSVTVGLQLPEWHYFGRGAGRGALPPVPPRAAPAGRRRRLNGRGRVATYALSRSRWSQARASRSGRLGSWPPDRPASWLRGSGRR